MNRIHNKAVLFTCLSALLFSISGLFIKLISLDAYSILFYRSIITAFFFLVLLGRNIFIVSKQMMISIAFYAPLMITFVLSTKLTTAANSIFLQYLAPAIVLVIEPRIFGSKLTKLNIYNVLACLIGMVLFFVDQFTMPKSWLGIALAIMSGFFLAGMIISQKLCNEDQRKSAVFWGNILVCVIMLPQISQFPFPMGHDLGYLLILGIGQLGLGFVFMIKGQKHLSAFESSIISMLEPIFNPIWVVIGYGEIPSFWALIGGMVIVGALVLRMYVLEKQKGKT